MFENLPDLIPPQLARREWHFSNQTIYRLVRIPGLGIRIGNRFFFIKKNFIQWIEQESMKEKAI